MTEKQWGYFPSSKMEATHLRVGKQNILVSEIDSLIREQTVLAQAICPTFDLSSNEYKEWDKQVKKAKKWLEKVQEAQQSLQYFRYIPRRKKTD